MLNLYEIHNELLSPDGFSLDKFEKEVDRQIANLPEDKKQDIKIRKFKEKKKKLFLVLGLNFPDDEIQASKILIEDRKFKSLKSFLELYSKNEDLIKFLFDNKSTPEDPNDLSHTIDEHWTELNKQFNYYSIDDEKLKDIYKSIYLICLYIASVVEETNLDDEIANRAYKLMVIFNEKNNLNKILNQCQRFLLAFTQHLQTPFHDIFQLLLPPAESFDLKAWQQLIYQNGLRVLKNISRADEIEKYLTHPPSSLQEIDDAVLHLIYERTNENPGLAALCQFYNVEDKAIIHNDVSERVFNRILDFKQAGKLTPKSSHFISPAFVDVEKEINSDRKSTFLVPIASESLQILIVGYITNCCLSIGGHSEKCIFDIVANPFHDANVLIKAKGKFDPNIINWSTLEKDGHRIAGVNNYWYTTADNLTIDSCENLRKDIDDEIMPDTLRTFSIKIIEKNPQISRVTIGIGGKTPEFFRNLPLTYPEKMKDGYFYGDAKKQVLIYENPSFTLLKSTLSDQLTKLNISVEIIDLTLSFMISMDQVKNILEFNDEILKNIISKKPQLFSYKIYAFAVKSGFNKFYEVLSKKNLSYINAITSINTMTFIKKGLINIDELFELDSEAIELLCSHQAYKLYKTGFVSFKELKNLDPKKIETFISRHQLFSFRKFYIKFSELINFDNEQLKIIISPAACILYENHIPINKITAIDIDQIKLNILQLISNIICKDDRQLNIHSVNDKQYYTLTSPSALDCYKTRMIKIYDLIEVKDENLLNLYLNDRSSVIYYHAYINDINFNVKDITNVQHFDILISYAALDAYKTGYVYAKDLNSITNENIINFLISYSMLEFYKEYNASSKDFITIKDLEIIKFLTSWKACRAYKEAKINIRDLNSVKDIQTAEILTSWEIYFIYNDNLKASDLVGYKIEELKLFIKRTCNFRRNKNLPNNFDPTIMKYGCDKINEYFKIIYELYEFLDYCISNLRKALEKKDFTNHLGKLQNGDEKLKSLQIILTKLCQEKLTIEKIQEIYEEAKSIFHNHSDSGLVYLLKFDFFRSPTNYESFVRQFALYDLLHNNLSIDPVDTIHP